MFWAQNEGNLEAEMWFYLKWNNSPLTGTIVVYYTQQLGDMWVKTRKNWTFAPILLCMCAVWCDVLRCAGAWEKLKLWKEYVQYTYCIGGDLLYEHVFHFRSCAGRRVSQRSRFFVCVYCEITVPGFGAFHHRVVGTVDVFAQA